LGPTITPIGFIVFGQGLDHNGLIKYVTAPVRLGLPATISARVRVCLGNQKGDSILITLSSWTIAIMHRQSRWLELGVTEAYIA
jgi:hypothetical protein